MLVFEGLNDYKNKILERIIRIGEADLPPSLITEQNSKLETIERILGKLT